MLWYISVSQEPGRKQDDLELWPQTFKTKGYRSSNLTLCFTNEKTETQRGQSNLSKISIIFPSSP